MTARKILIIDGHPDPDRARFVHALADAYAAAATAHEVRRLDLAGLDIPVLQAAADWINGKPSPEMLAAQADIEWADHLVILYPLWLGDMPALLKAFFEQVMRPGFALQYGKHRLPEKLLRGRSARVIVTMGMPALFYRLVYGAHSVKSLERNILKFVGIRPVARTIIGAVEASADHRREWLDEMAALGEKGE